MIELTAGLSIVLGLVYLQYGTMTAAEMVRRRQARIGFSVFGAAWIAMAFTCGPHHFVHGGHMLVEGRSAGMLELLAVVVGVPAGITWFYLRLEAWRGGPGDRFIRTTPLWLMVLPTLAGAYLAAMIAGSLATGGWASVPGGEGWAIVGANALLVAVYLVIAVYLIRTQLANHVALGGWSLSGLSLATVFVTCAVMHGVYGLYVLNGTYTPELHMLAIDALAVPAGVFFLIVVRALSHGSYRDWSGAPQELAGEVAHEPEGVAAGV